MENEELRGGMSRRTAIKSVAAGTALVWAAPAITTMGGSAFANESPVPCPGTNWKCADPIVACGTSGPLGLCVCDTTVEGRTFCWENFLCVDTHACASTADCSDLPGYACVTSCCDESTFRGSPSCAPPCGANVVSTTTDGASAAG